MDAGCREDQRQLRQRQGCMRVLRKLFCQRGLTLIELVVATAILLTGKVVWR